MAKTFNGTTDIVAGTITAMADGDWTVGAWINAASAGEGGLGRVFDCAGTGSFSCFLGAGPILQTFFAYGTTSATSASSTTFAVNTWALAFFTHRASDNKPRTFMGDLVTPVAENAYTSQVAGVGTYQGDGTAAKIGNRADTARTFDGRIHAPFLLPRELTVDEMERFRLGDWKVLFNGAVVPRFFCPMDSPTASVCEDLSGNSVAFTVTGTTASEGPPVPGGF